MTTLVSVSRHSVKRIRRRAQTAALKPSNIRAGMRSRLSNRWVQLIVVPQNGGRLMQVMFAGHAYLFVNPKFAGKYFPPSSSQWFNYGGDKLWLLPEGNNDEQHWVGDSDLLDDGPFHISKAFGRAALRDRTDGPVRSADRNSIYADAFAWTPIPRASDFTRR